MNDIEVYVDGGVVKSNIHDSRGKGYYAFAMYKNDHGSLDIFASKRWDKPFMTVPEAEMNAVIEALDYIVCLGDSIQVDNMLVKSDSELVIKWIDGSYTCRAGNIIPLLNKIRRFIKMLEQSNTRVKFQKISGKQNWAHDLVV